MNATLEQLEQRLTAVERELSSLRERLDRPAGTDTPSPWHDIPMLRKAYENQAAISAAAREAFAAMGISGEPVGALEIQRRMLEEGIRPEDNAFSRELIEMRDE